jgi:hypothetical protein
MSGVSSSVCRSVRRAMGRVDHMSTSKGFKKSVQPRTVESFCGMYECEQSRRSVSVRSPRTRVGEGYDFLRLPWFDGEVRVSGS